SQLAQLLWYATLYRVSPPGVRDVPCLIRWQARVNPRLEPLGIARGDGGDDRTYVSRHQAGRPEIIEIGECPQHRDLARFDRIEACSGPQIPQGFHPRCAEAWGEQGLEAHRAHLCMDRLRRPPCPTHRSRPCRLAAQPEP